MASLLDQIEAAMRVPSGKPQTLVGKGIDQPQPYKNTNLGSGFPWPSGGKLPFWSPFGSYSMYVNRNQPPLVMAGTYRLPIYVPSYIDWGPR